jgi:tetratricopeptide (TPR) repeat protein
MDTERERQDAVQALRTADRLFSEGKLFEAGKLYQQNFRHAPDKRLALNRLVEIAFATRNFETCIEFARRALRIDGNQPRVWLRLASSLVRMERADEALAAADQAVARAPDSPQVHAVQALALALAGRFDEAFHALDKAKRLDPDSPRVWADRAYVLKRAGRYTDALEAFQQSVVHNPAGIDNRINLALLYQDLGQLDQAVSQIDEAIKVDPNNARAHFARAELLLLQGDYRNGWAEYRWRWATQYRRNAARGPYPQWSGDEPLEGKRVLVRGEVGFGDFIMFARYVRLVQQRGAKVVVHANASLLRLFASLGPDVELVDDSRPLPAADFQCSIMEFPRAFGTLADTVPVEFPYLAAPAEVRDAWGQKLGPRTRPRVGVMWWGHGNRNIDSLTLRRRSMPFEVLQPLLECDVEFHALQKEFSDEDRPLLAQSGRVQMHEQALTDFAETAGLASSMDLVISIDTSVAHVAGALAKPLWMLLPFSSDYRWGGALPQSPWYPDARLFRQQTPGDWEGVVAEVAGALKKFAAT